MALETLKNLKHLNNIEVKRVEWNHPKENFIEINDKENAITFKIQNGPVKENGVNGCQVDDMIGVVMLMIDGLNKKFPCEENEQAIVYLRNARFSLLSRKKDREKRGVEGENKL